MEKYQERYSAVNFLERFFSFFVHAVMGSRAVGKGYLRQNINNLILE